MSECLFTFWLLLALWALGDEKRPWFLLLIGGLAIGLATLTRPVGLLLLPAFGVAQLWTQWRAAWKPVLWVGLTALLVIAPWTLRNYLIHGTLVPVSTHGGFIIARSNAAEPAWRQDHGWGIKAEVFRNMPSEVERDRYWFGQAREFVLEHPGTYLRLVGERFLRFWYFFRPSYNFFFALVMPFFLLGFYRYGLRPPLLLPSIFITISTAVFCTVLYGSTRFRLPMEPLFIAYAAVFLSAAWSRWGVRRWAIVVGGALTFNLLAWWGEEALRQLLVGGLDSFGLR
jgi:4-amino-4-deoxy-L-arabinose transferase-like glycosyltransferase